MDTKTTKATVDLTQNNEGLWITVGGVDHPKASVFLDAASRGPIVREALEKWAANCFQYQESKMKKFLAFVTGAVAIAVVASSAGSAVTYAIMHGTETLIHLGNSALSGVGMAVGGCLGSALVLRFKIARHYVKGVLNEIKEHPVS